MMASIKPDSSRFFDGGTLDGKDAQHLDQPPRICLERLIERKRSHFKWLERHMPSRLRTDRVQEVFALERRIGYRARGHEEDIRFVVPADDTFRSDLTSVPDLFTWLVPRTGLHLPAALLHDGLVHDPNSPVTYDGPHVTRQEADRIFREAMADLGTGWVRRWLMWSAVTLATVRAGVKTRTRDAATGKVPTAVEICNWYYRLAVFGSLSAIGALGILATIDLADWWDGLPWMGERGMLAELTYGFAAAVAIALGLSVFWGVRLMPAGAIAGVTLAVLFHVTVALVVLTVIFQMMEFIARFRHTRPNAPPAQSAERLPGDLTHFSSANTEAT